MVLAIIKEHCFEFRIPLENSNTFKNYESFVKFLMKGDDADEIRIVCEFANEKISFHLEEFWNMRLMFEMYFNSK